MKSVYYYLFGFEIARVYMSGGVREALNYGKNHAFALEKYTPTVQDPKLILFEASCWGGFVEISEEEYKQLLFIKK